MKVTVLPNQTLSDIAIQEYGAEEAVFLIAQANNISPTDVLTAGTMLQCLDRTFNKQMQAYCKNNRISPATAETSDSEIRLRIFTEQFTEQFM